MSNQTKWYLVKNNPRQYNICLDCNKVGNVNFGNSKAKVYRCKFCGSDNIYNMMNYKTMIGVDENQAQAFNNFKEYCGMGQRAKF